MCGLPAKHSEVRKAVHLGGKPDIDVVECLHAARLVKRRQSFHVAHHSLLLDELHQLLAGLGTYKCKHIKSTFSLNTITSCTRVIMLQVAILYKNNTRIILKKKLQASQMLLGP
jgi:hypothetical protein